MYEMADPLKAAYLHDGTQLCRAPHCPSDPVPGPTTTLPYQQTWVELTRKVKGWHSTGAVGCYKLAPAISSPKIETLRCCG